MMKCLFKGFLALFLLSSLYIGNASAQDTTKREEPVKKEEPAKTTAVKPPAAKPVHHYIRKVVPLAPSAVTSDTASANALKAQMDPAQLNDKSLNGQYQYLFAKTYHYQQPLLAALWKNFTDTLNQSRSQLKALQSKLGTQSKAVDSLKASSTSKDQSLTESNAKADAISLFGIMLPKSTYNLVMFGSVIVLAVALIIVIMTTAKYKHEAKYRVGLYEEIEEEYKTFKAKANEKEIKLARELQTERNKLDELLGRG